VFSERKLAKNGVFGAKNGVFGAKKRAKKKVF